jgi:hypothetical protein
MKKQPVLLIQTPEQLIPGLNTSIYMETLESISKIVGYIIGVCYLYKIINDTLD